MTGQVKCRATNCDFEGTQDEVDDHFVERIRVVDPDHAQMPLRHPELPADFTGRVSVLGECFHDNHQFIRLADPDLGWVTYCRDCHAVADSPVLPKCTCGRGPHRDMDFEGSNGPAGCATTALRITGSHAR
jgi:hypothetical protein